MIAATSFFLGILFTNWAYDHHTLWTSIEPTEAILSQIEAHYTFLWGAPPIVPRLLHAVIAVGILGFLGKLYRASESNYLFDGASLVLYIIGLIMYGTNVTKGLQIVQSGDYGDEVGRVDTLKVMAASQVILALVLVGVLVLQSGQWYAERKEAQEMEEMDNDATAAAAAGGAEGEKRERRVKKRN